MLKSKYLIVFLISIVVLPVFAFEFSRPQFKIDTEKYGDLIVREASSAGDLISKRAIDTYELNYFVARNHKAIAQSSEGTWSWTHDMETSELAMDRALQLCQAHNQTLQETAPCKLVNIDGYWIADFLNTE